MFARRRNRGGCSYRVSGFSLSAAATRVSVPRNIRECVSSVCNRVSESHCEARSIYNYLAGVLFQQDCEVNKPAGEEREGEKDERGPGARRGIECTNFELVQRRLEDRWNAQEWRPCGRGRRYADRDGKGGREKEGRETSRQ